MNLLDSLKNSDKLNTWLKKEAMELGFSGCGIGKVESLESERKGLEMWLKNGNHGKMSYMENHFEMRLNPSLLMEGAQSIICLLYNYFPEQELNQNDNFKIAKYAYGKDYHKVIRKKLKIFVNKIQEKVGDVGTKICVDSAPILEKSWAVKTGLGWRGKHTNLINPNNGSWFFLAEILTDVVIQPDDPFVSDHCGTCTRCQDACPTDALHTAYEIDANKCISYLTIELKDEIENSFAGQMQDWIFGCDICQDVCPWNRFSTTHQESKFRPSQELQSMSKGQWEQIDKMSFERIFEGSAVKRTGLVGLKRNIDFIRR